MQHKNVVNMTKTKSANVSGKEPFCIQTSHSGRRKNQHQVINTSESHTNKHTANSS